MDAFGCKGTIRTRSGQYLDLLDPRPEQIDIGDIAGALSKICRFGGQIEQFYSVAEHSLLCAEVAGQWYPGNREILRAALMHDAAEAYIGDLVKPLKVLMDKVEMIETMIQNAIAIRFGLDFESTSDEVTKIDRGMLIAERNTLFTRDDEKWTGEDEVTIPKVAICAWGPTKIEWLFMQQAVAMGIR